MTGVTLNLTGFDPIRALFWSAVINGIVAVPVMVYMMLFTAKRSVMGQFPGESSHLGGKWFCTRAGHQAPRQAERRTGRG